MAEEDRPLMARYQSGDAAAFELLYGRLAPGLRATVRQRLPSAPADAVVEQIFVEMHRTRSSYNPAKPFDPWVAAIARHVITRNMRSGDRWRRLGEFIHRLVASRSARRPLTPHSPLGPR